MDPLTRSKRARLLVAGPAFAIALAACGGAESEVATTAEAAAPAPAEVSEERAPIADPEATATTATTASAPEASAAAPATEASEPVASDASDAADPETAAAPAGVSTRPPVQVLSADVAIENADANIGNLVAAQTGDNVLDMEVLAVGDGSVQTLRDVVDGDRPVLLWFFSPH